MRTIVPAFLVFIIVCNINACKQEVKNDKIKNGIEIQEKGLHVEEAFLTNGDSLIINNNNQVRVGELVCLRMVIHGWNEEKGKVFMDASQKVSTGSGVTLVENPSIFGITLFNGTLLQNAKHVLLYQKIGRLNKPNDYILISFKVWDKTTNKSVSGSYKLHE